MFISRVENSFDPDQLSLQKPADLNLPCFQKQGTFRFNMARVKEITDICDKTRIIIWQTDRAICHLNPELSQKSS